MSLWQTNSKQNINVSICVCNIISFPIFFPLKIHFNGQQSNKSLPHHLKPFKENVVSIYYLVYMAYRTYENHFDGKQIALKMDHLSPQTQWHIQTRAQRIHKINCLKLGLNQHLLTFVISFFINLLHLDWCFLRYTIIFHLDNSSQCCYGRRNPASAQGKWMTICRLLET